MSDHSPPAQRSPSEIAEQQADAAETMEDDQRLLFENAQRIEELHPRTAAVDPHEK